MTEYWYNLYLVAEKKNRNNMKKIFCSEKEKILKKSSLHTNDNAEHKFRLRTTSTKEQKNMEML